MALDPRDLTFIRILGGLHPEEITTFLGACTTMQAPADTMLIEEGEIDRSILVVLDGALEVFVGRPPLVTTLRHALRGEHLGELAALGLVPQRTASVRALSSCDLLILGEAGLAHLRELGHPVVDRVETQVLHTLAAMLRETNRRIATLAAGEVHQPRPQGFWARLLRSLGQGRPLARPPQAVRVLGRSAHFIGMNHALMDRLAQDMVPVAFAEGEHVLDQGAVSGDAWVVAAGRIGTWRETAADRHQRLGTLGEGTLFGHLAMMDGNSRTATCIAETPAWLYRIPREVCESLVDDHTPDGRALRRCLINASVQQLTSANQRLKQITQVRTARHRHEISTAAVDRAG